MRPKLLLVTNRKSSHTWAFDWHQDRWPWMTFNSISSNFQWISWDFADFGRTTAKRMKIGQYCQRQRCKHVELEQFLAGFLRRAGLSAIAGLSCYRSNGMYKRDYAFRMNAMEEIFQIRSCIERMDGWLGLNGILSTQVAAVVDEVSLIIICKDSKWLNRF